MELLDLPPEILCTIIDLCGPGAITETCCTFARIATLTPALWTSVHLGPLQFVPEGREWLRTRLSRAAKLGLTVSVQEMRHDRMVLPDLPIIRKGVIKDLCVILSEWNVQIAHIKISAETKVGAETILSTIFPNLTPSVVFSTLRSLSVYIERDCHCRHCGQPQDLTLSSSITDLHIKFPRLQSLSISGFSGCLLSFPPDATFSHLRTLVLDGARGDCFTDICIVTELLSNVPQLETLWLKHEDNETDSTALTPVSNWEEYKGYYPLRVFLPHLVQLAIAAPGTGTDLLYCLEAPSLEDLHLDSSRLNEWLLEDEASIASVQEALKNLASRSLGLRRLAFTKANPDLKSLLFGDGGRPPFPQLETLAFHGVSEKFGLYDALLLQLAEQRTIPLRRLVILQCTFSFAQSTLVQLFQNLTTDEPNKEYELEIDIPCGQITDDDLDTLKAVGVQVIRRDRERAKMDGWWTLGHEVDASDSLAY